MRGLAVSLAITTAWLTVAGRADAFCRTTTVSIPANYDPTVSGCITEGTPLAWPSMPVSYELNQAASVQISLEAATPIFDAAFASWGEVSCSTTDATEHPSVSFDRLAPTDASFVPCDAEACEEAEADGPHQIVFRDDDWPYDDTANTIALTTVTFGADSGHIRAADMEINSHDHTISGAEPAPSGAISLAAIARHEAGHFIGLAHSQDDAAVMYAFYQPNVASLTPDDIEGVCAIYPPAGPSSASGCGCALGERPADALALASTAAAIAAITARRRRRR